MTPTQNFHFPRYEADHPCQKVLCAIPGIGHLLSTATNTELNQKIATAPSPLHRRELQRIQKDYILADSFRYLLTALLIAPLVIKWLS